MRTHHELEMHPRVAGRISFWAHRLLTAVLLTVGYLFSYQNGATQADAGYKNNTSINKTEVSNRRNYYQAKSNEQNLVERVQALLPADRQEACKKEAERYQKEKTESSLRQKSSNTGLE